MSCIVASAGEWELVKGSRTYLADAATLLTENLLSVGGANDDVGNGRSNTDFDTGVTLLSEFALEELVELGVEHTVGDELSALRDIDAAEGLGGCGSLSHAGLCVLKRKRAAPITLSATGFDRYNCS